MLLRNSAVSVLVLNVLSVVIYVTASALQQTSSLYLSAARVNFEQVSTSATQIAQEEETIIRYIDQYVQITTDGIVGKQDRLQLLEHINGIRESLQLYAMELSIGEQISYVLPYLPEDPLPGKPVTLQQTPINLEMSLLHEGDLLRMLDRLLSLPSLFQPTECVMDLNTSSTVRFTPLGENLKLRCSFNWYSFELWEADSLAQEGI